MSQNSQWDDLTFPELSFPYNTIAAGLSDAPRLVEGSLNTAVTLGGTLIKRYGIKGVPSTASLPANARIDRCWVYETMDTPVPNVYIVASVLVGSVWKLYYCLISSSVFWTLATAYRGCNLSLQPHEAITARGLLYVKSFPAPGDDLLGTVILDGTGGTMHVRPWGALGPVTPAAIVGVKNNLSAAVISTDTALVYTATSTFPATPFNIIIDYETITVTANNTGTKTLTCLRGAQGTIPASHGAGALILQLPWTASAHPVTINIFWKYSYAYKSITGNVTNRVDIETNPDNLPSVTGPFQNLIPQVTLQGLADTTNFPKIIVFRTTDGGGTFFVLEEITNPGAGAFTYSDDSLVSAGGSHDPLPDSLLNAVTVAPTLTSNSPPPANLAPKVTGVDGLQPSTPLAYYSSRIWYAIGNVLFYSGDEEITDGIPEECFPSGTLGNFFRYQTPVLNVQSTTNALYVVCSDTIHVITGSTKDTFNSSPVIQAIGAPYNHPRAITRYGENIIFLSNDYRVISASGSSYLPLSDELGTDLQTLVDNGAEVDIKYFADLDKEYAVVAAINKTVPANSTVFIYDIKRSLAGSSGARHNNFWYSPWTTPTTCLAVGRLQNGVNKNSLIFAQEFSGTSFLGTYDVTGATKTDTNPSGASINTFNMFILTNLFQTPSGNHINALRQPGVTTTVNFIQLDRTKYSSDTDPNVTWYADDLWTTPIALPAPTGPVFRIPSKGYTTLVYAVQTVCQRVALKIQKLASAENFELQNITIIFIPNNVGG